MILNCMPLFTMNERNKFTSLRNFLVFKNYYLNEIPLQLLSIRVNKIPRINSSASFDDVVYQHEIYRPWSEMKRETSRRNLISKQSANKTSSRPFKVFFENVSNSPRHQFWMKSSSLKHPWALIYIYLSFLHRGPILTVLEGARENKRMSDFDEWPCKYFNVICYVHMHVLESSIYGPSHVSCPVHVREKSRGKNFICHS